MAYTSFTPVDPETYDLIDNLAENNKKFKVFYFDPDSNLEEQKGKYTGIQKEKDGEYLIMQENKKIRLDRVVTINGKPGPAFEEYDNYSNACLSCQGGYDENL
ncbi:MAG: hypothetical protein ACOCXS_02820 [Bacteroidota bacterium]